jgi:hypothetical protein
LTSSACSGPKRQPRLLSCCWSTAPITPDCTGCSARRSRGSRTWRMVSGTASVTLWQGSCAPTRSCRCWSRSATRRWSATICSAVRSYG